ncbi:hypothetical protein CRM22_010216 [Opisthorchis felineus]|uniref:Uncharacterized protein n=1 Tax=Opisthorchis felineus TaxID=147828 RepID=A0A4S2L1U5_OPIFE|nr:hypothetical protein CRM22_010216 [Opisthorchis felineus]
MRSSHAFFQSSNICFRGFAPVVLVTFSWRHAVSAQPNRISIPVFSVCCLVPLPSFHWRSYQYHSSRYIKLTSVFWQLKVSSVGCLFRAMCAPWIKIHFADLLPAVPCLSLLDVFLLPSPPLRLYSVHTVFQFDLFYL